MQKELKNKINSILNFIPNIALDDVPIGKDEKSNKELKNAGNVPKFNFKVKSHYEIGSNLNLMDFDTATKNMILISQKTMILIWWQKL